MKYFLIVLTILSLSACQIHQEANNLEKPTVLEKQETSTDRLLSVANVYYTEDGKNVEVWFYETPSVYEFSIGSPNANNNFEKLKYAEENYVPVNVRTTKNYGSIIDLVSPATAEQIEKFNTEVSEGEKAEKLTEDPTGRDLNTWKDSPWKREVAAKKDKNILDYFYLAPTKLFCDSYVVSEEDYETELKNHPESPESILVENMKGMKKLITKKNIENDYILADMPVGSELQFARFQNTKGDKDIFIAVANRGAGDMCNQFDIWEWDENKGWNTIKEENILPQKEIEKNWEGRNELKEDTIDSYILPEFGTTIKVYGAPFDESEEPTFIYSLVWNGEKFTFE